MGEVKDSSSGLEFQLHPLVVINTSDHYTRVKANSPQQEQQEGGTAGPRVLGCLLGAQVGRTVDISNSFELACTTAPDGATVLDEAFLLKRQEQYKQVFPKLDIVGWYSSGAALSPGDIALHQKLAAYNESPVYLLLMPEARAARGVLPLQLFESELHHTEGVQQQVFVKAQFSMETSEGERIAVNDVAQVQQSASDRGSDQLAAHFTAQRSAVEVLSRHIQDLVALLSDMAAQRIPYSHAVVREAGGLLKQLPTVDDPAFRESYLAGHSDSLLTLLLAGMTQGANAMNEYVEKVNRAFERVKRKGGRLGGAGPGGSTFFYDSARAAHADAGQPGSIFTGL